MPVNTKQVKNRRNVHYESWDDLRDDLQLLSQSEIKTLGNWSPGQIYEHLARALDGSIDGFDFALPAPARWLMTLFMKRKFLTKPIPAGFKAPKKDTPGPTPDEQGLAALRSAIDRQCSESHRALHPAFGTLTRREWDEFHLRHAEMHMSFLVPENVRVG